LLVFTSNEGCDGERGLFGCSRAEITERLSRRFRPEFLDRIESFVPFAPLGPAARRRVAASQLDELRARVLEVHGRSISWDESLLDFASIAPPGQAGVRNVLRWIQGDVKPAVVFALIGGDALSPGRPIRIRLDDAARVIVEPCVGDAPAEATP
jgi:ATP-dependent Clp protease ATP-binding subunit ClpB